MFKHLWYGLIGGSFIILLAGCSAGNNTGGSANNPGTITSGPVSIATDHTVYAPTNGIQVTIKNQLNEDIFALDTRASCTILGLQEQAHGTWQGSNAARCPLGRVARPVKIAKGQSYTATIQPGTPGVANAAFPNGTYRLVLVYAMSESDLGILAHVTTIYSATLMVSGQEPGGTSGQPHGTPAPGTPVSIPSVTPRPGP